MDKLLNIFNLNSVSAAQVNEIHKFYGFPEPANENMVSIIDMFHNTVITLSYIMIAVLFFVAFVLDMFEASKNAYPTYFTKWQESMIDAFVVLVPLIVIWYITVPTVGYVLHNDRFLQYLDSSFTIEIVGHQWYWTYYLDCIQNNFLFDFIYFVRQEESLPFFFADKNNVDSFRR
jgi:heme/copper-type cytochrome/quinol oxidase subunit 2